MRHRSLLLVPLVIALLCASSAANAGSGSTSLVVAQLYASGGNSGATYANDYVELFNRGTSSVDLTGWTVQYASAASTSWSATALSGTVAPGRAYLVRARLRRRERRCASCRGRDRDVEPRCDGRQGRRREQRHAALVRCDSWLVRGHCRRRRLRRVRHRRRLRRRRRGSRSRCDIGDRPTRGRLHRHRLEHGRLLDDRTCSRQLVCGRFAVLRWRWLVLCIRRAHRCVCRSSP